MQNREEDLNPQRKPGPSQPNQPGREPHKENVPGGGQTPPRTGSGSGQGGNMPSSGRSGSSE